MFGRHTFAFADAKCRNALRDEMTDAPFDPDANAQCVRDRNQIVHIDEADIPGLLAEHGYVMIDRLVGDWLNTALAPTAGVGFRSKPASPAPAWNGWLPRTSSSGLFYGVNHDATTATGIFQGTGEPPPAAFTWSNYNVQEVRVAMSYKF